MKTLLAVDVGNTNITLGLFEEHNQLGEYRIESHPPRTPAYYTRQVEKFRKNLGLSDIPFNGVAIGSVVPKLTEPLARMAQMGLGYEPLMVDCELNLGLKLLVDNPTEVGADRLCNVVAAKAAYPCPSIVVDLGTATTFDVLDREGNYIGGAIAPGMITAANNLFQKAARLYPIPLEFPSGVIGKNTTTHMQSGILIGHVALIEGMISRIAGELGWPEIFVIATGGFSEIIAGHSALIRATDPHLTLNGLRLIFQMNSGER